MAEIDWLAIREYYDSGMTLRQAKERFGFSNHAWDKAVARGDIQPRSNPQKQWKHETRNEVKRLIDRGLSHSEIAFELGISKPTVSYHAQKLGVPRNAKAARRYDWEAVQVAHDQGLSPRRCRLKFGFSSSAWSDAVAKGKVKPRPHLIPMEEILVAGGPRSRDHLKRRLLKAGLKEERCEDCGISEWLGEPLRMTLHHVNGDGYDNRLENLRFLCPNCHSRTSNYGGRNGHLRANPTA